MVNQNIQSPIVIPGPGHVVRRNGDLRPGEYKKLVNCEIKDGRIVNRRNIRTKEVTAVTDTNLAHREPIGHWNDWTIYSTLNFVIEPELSFAAVKDDLTDEVVSPGVLTGIGITTNYTYHNEVGAFQYNNTFYLLVWGWDSTLASVTYKLVAWDDSDYRETPNFTSADAPVSTDIIVVPFNDAGITRRTFKNYFIYKDRLWITTEGRLYFSKATDFTEFDVVDGGGYFGFEGEKVNYAFACNNIVYVICDSAVFAVTYNADPNEDSVVTKISESTGGLHGCEFRGSPYLINNDGIYLIYNNYLERVFNTDLDLGLNNYPHQTITPFIDYLVINKCYIESQLDAEPLTSLDLRVNRFPWPGGGDEQGDPPQLLSGAVFAPSPTLNPIATTIEWGVSGDAHTGTEALKLTAAAGNGKFGIYSTLKFKVEQGKRYMFSVWGKSATAGLAVDALILEYDDALAFQGDEPFDGGNCDGTIDLTGSYARFHGYYDVNVGVEYIDIMIRFDAATAAADIVFLDDFLFEEVGVAVTTPGTDFNGGTADSGDTQYGYQTTTLYSNTSTQVSYEVTAPYKYELSLVRRFGRDYADIDGNENDYNLFFLNVNEASLHVVDFKPIYCSSIASGSDYVEFANGISVNPNVSNSPLLMMFDHSDYTDAGGLGSPTPVAAMEYELDTAIADKLLEKTNLTSTHVYTTKKRNPQILIEKNSICPDGNEYLMKKYRNLEIMAKFPKNDFEILLAYDNAAYGSALEIVDNEALLLSGEYRGHIPHRIGLNQRARELSVKIRSKFNAAPENTDWDFLEISDMRVLWGYTNRAPLHRSFTP